MLTAAVIVLAVVLVAAIGVQLAVTRRLSSTPAVPPGSSPASAPVATAPLDATGTGPATATGPLMTPAPPEPDALPQAGAESRPAPHPADRDAELAEIARARVDLEHERAQIAAAHRQLVEARRALADERQADLQLRQQLAEDRARFVHQQELLAGMTAAEARAELVAGAIAEATLDAQQQARRIEADATSSAETRARSIVAHAVQRLATETTSEVTVVSVRLPDDEFKGRVIGREGRNIKTFEAITGVEVLIDQPETVQLSCFDPLRREVARMTMAELVADGRIHPQRIEETYQQSLAKIDAVCRRAAEDALLRVGISDLHDVLVEHLGALRFRTSYGQNVLAHLVESAAVAGTMAAELGLPPQQVTLVKRCAFLHDIGKALTHDHEGSHALLGADLARRYGESEAVAHAIEAHHNEVPPTTIEAVLTQASDACSGGRPGARRESAQAYTDRLARIEEIARQQPGVERVYAMQAGHEVRVMVEPDQVDDLAAAQIARAVAKQVEQELTYPGQIRVTVVRESRVSEVAH